MVITSSPTRRNTKVSNWIREEKTEEAYEALHGIRPAVYRWLPRVSNTSRVRLVRNEKEVFITEIIGKKGMTDVVHVEHAGETHDFSRVYDAELEANKLLE